MRWSRSGGTTEGGRWRGRPRAARLSAGGVESGWRGSCDLRIQTNQTADAGHVHSQPPRSRSNLSSAAAPGCTDLCSPLLSFSNVTPLSLSIPPYLTLSSSFSLFLCRVERNQSEGLCAGSLFICSCEGNTMILRTLRYIQTEHGTPLVCPGTAQSLGGARENIYHRTE